MIQQIQEKVRISIKRDDDLESLFSIEDEPTEKSLCAIPTYFSENDSDFSDSSICMTMQIPQDRQKQYRIVVKDTVPVPQVLCGHATQLGSFLTAWIHRIYPDEVTYSDNEYRNLLKYLCQLNRVIPVEIWPPPDIDTPWDTVPDRPYY
ncbi:hypothetical protein J1N35_004011 [Gossypium stocksii]|uniref:Uncharacterized protein n=1 Tax=Gossypium stocksii TaxID=47602 RepID=A0A9D3WAX6_9ROSI|nr:hypothetical protein J1N35_004011 [Gossypium stocksii]